MPGKQLSLYARRRMKALFCQGTTVKEVEDELAAEQIVACQQTVWRFLSHYRKHGLVQALRRSGRPTKLTEAVQDVIEEAMQADNETTVEELVVILRTKCNISVSPCTTLKGRKLLGWSSRGAHYCPLIHNVNKEMRLVWAREYLNDPFLDVVWTDETTVQLETHRRFCCKKKGDQRPRYKPRPKHPVKVHVWAGISYMGTTKLCIFEGIMNAELYLNILNDCLVPSLRRMYPGGHRFMQDNDPKHTSRRAQAFFDDKLVENTPREPRC